MSTTISSIGQDAATTTTAASATGGDSATKKSDAFGMDKDAFLKILVEQLRHQDPSSPGDSQQYVQQMTQYSMLEQLTNISQSVQVQHADSAASTALGLVGRTITWMDGDEEHSGVVDKVTFGESGARLTVGASTDIQLAAITEVS